MFKSDGDKNPNKKDTCNLSPCFLMGNDLISSLVGFLVLRLNAFKAAPNSASSSNSTCYSMMVSMLVLVPIHVNVFLVKWQYHRFWQSFTYLYSFTVARLGSSYCIFSHWQRFYSLTSRVGVLKGGRSTRSKPNFKRHFYKMTKMLNI